MKNSAGLALCRIYVVTIMMIGFALMIGWMGNYHEHYNTTMMTTTSTMDDTTKVGHHQRILTKQQQQHQPRKTKQKQQRRHHTDTNTTTTTATYPSPQAYEIPLLFDQQDYLGITYLQDQMERYRIEAFRVYETYEPTTEPTRMIDKSPITILPTISQIPTRVQSHMPTIVPTTKPSPIPTILPSDTPTLVPSDTPTNIPSHIPSLHPTVLPGYYNYDTSNTSLYGPGIMANPNMNQTTGIILNNHWGDVPLPKIGTNNYWEEFTDAGFGTWKGVFEKYHPTTLNVCQIGESQSPVDVRDNGGLCEEFHQVRTRDGKFPLSDNDHVYKQILSNKLRIEYVRRPCQNATLCPDGVSPPSADFPHGWGGYCDVLHVDIKIPSEHYLNGIQYDAEMQIYHIHAGNKRLATQTVMIHVNGTSTLDDGSYNYYFQELINEFQKVYDRNMASCPHLTTTMKSSTSSTLVPTNPDTIHETDTNGTDSNATNTTNMGRRYLQQQQQSPMFNNTSSSGNKINTTTTIKPVKLKVFNSNNVWDPHNWNLIPTYWFYRYDGSLTEPPCSEMVSWFVADTPMTISIEQLEQLEHILFDNVDPVSCHTTSVHDPIHGVARPIRPVNDRPIWQCTSKDFGPDNFGK